MLHIFHHLHKALILYYSLYRCCKAEHSYLHILTFVFFVNWCLYYSTTSKLVKMQTNTRKIKKHNKEPQSQHRAQTAWERGWWTECWGKVMGKYRRSFGDMFSRYGGRAWQFDVKITHFLSKRHEKIDAKEVQRIKPDLKNCRHFLFSFVYLSRILVCTLRKMKSMQMKYFPTQ